MQHIGNTLQGYKIIAEELEHILGDPFDPRTPFSYQRVMDFDEREEFPVEFCQQLEGWGLQEYYIPGRYKGKLNNLGDLHWLIRIISRRDLSTAIAHSKTFLGSSPVWIAGTEEQRLDLAQRIRGREYIALALTEEAHGGDLAATECFTRKIYDHYLLRGEKWLINNATRSTVLCLLARTRIQRGPLGCSLFYVVKEQLDPTSFQHLAKIRTHGVRGIDISGIRFNNAMIGENALIGKEQYGFEPVLKTFQITRPLCSALSLGAADTALRIVLDFALQRHIYGDSVFAIPVAQEILVKAFVDLLICDCVAFFAVRALHVLPRQMSLWSSVTKYLVPTVIEKMMHNLSTILGARYYLREHHVSGIFQKIVRDVALVSLFDGSTQVNLSLIASQLGQIVRDDPFGISAKSEVLDRLEQICSFGNDLPEFFPEQLALTNHGRDELRVGLFLAVEQLNRFSTTQGVASSVINDLRVLLDRFKRMRQTLDQNIRGLVVQKEDFHVSVEGFDLAMTHCILHAASACYYMWLYNRSRSDEMFASGQWLVLCLIRLLKLLYPQEEIISANTYVVSVSSVMLNYLRENRLFSIIPIRLNSKGNSV